MNSRIGKGELTVALSAAQAEFPVLTQDKAGYNYTYLTLPNILNELRPILGKHGIAIVQGSSVKVKDEMPFVSVETRLMHKDEYLSETMEYPLGEAPKGMTEIQYMGSIQSYLRRYGILSMLGIAGQEKEIEDIQSEEIKLK